MDLTTLVIVGITLIIWTMLMRSVFKINTLVAETAAQRKLLAIIAMKLNASADDVSNAVKDVNIKSLGEKLEKWNDVGDVNRK